MARYPRRATKFTITGRIKGQLGYVITFSCCQDRSQVFAGQSALSDYHHNNASHWDAKVVCPAPSIELKGILILQTDDGAQLNYSTQHTVQIGEVFWVVKWSGHFFQRKHHFTGGGARWCSRLQGVGATWCHRVVVELSYHAAWHLCGPHRHLAAHHILVVGEYIWQGLLGDLWSTQFEIVDKHSTIPPFSLRSCIIQSPYHHLSMHHP